MTKIRPEKDHPAQLRAFAQLLDNHPEYTKKSGAKDPVCLVLIGGSRNEEDAQRVADLHRLTRELGVEVDLGLPSAMPIAEFFLSLINVQDQTEIIVNATYPIVLEWLSRASVGLSTMVDEHFGINIVEFMVRPRT